ncbi:MAG: YlxR family protein [Clostridia bacterium]|nr:YlxR family protein [Clostridia bacterium]
MPKKQPVRQCVACREKREKRDLARVVRTPEGAVVYDARGKAPGRGAYLCKSTACLERALKSRALQRALECELTEETASALRDSFKEAEDG